MSSWFETVAEAQRRAKKRLPYAVYGAILGGTQAGQTLEDNTAAFSELGFAPRIAELPAEPQTATSIMGQPSALPVMIAPVGVQGVHPQAEVALAKAAALSLIHI